MAEKGENLVCAVGDVGHRQGQRREALARIGGRGERCAEQVGRRATFGEGRIIAGRGQRRFVIGVVGELEHAHAAVVVACRDDVDLAVHRDRRHANDAIEQQRGVVADIRHIGQLAVGAHCEDAQTIIVGSGDEQIGRAAQDDGRQPDRIVQLQHAVVGKVEHIGQCAIRRDRKDGQPVVAEPADHQIGGAADCDSDGVNRPAQLHRAGIRNVEHVGQVAVRRDRVHADAVVMESGHEHIGVAVDRRRRQPLRALDLRNEVVGHVVHIGQRAVCRDREHAHAVVVDAAGKQVGRAADHHRLDVGGEGKLQRRAVAGIRHVGERAIGRDGEDADAGVVHTTHEQIGGAADHRGRQRKGAAEVHDRGVGDVGDVGQRAIGAEREHADAVVAVAFAGHEDIGGPADDRRRHVACATELERRVVADVEGIDQIHGHGDRLR